MNENFGNWAKVGKLSIDQLEERILTHAKEKQFAPEYSLLSLIGDKTKGMSVLDFGCGLGRNTWPIASHSEVWMVTGYDNPNMLTRIPEYREMSKRGMTRNMRFASDWDSLKREWFDCIVCSLVLQHICEAAIVEYVNDFKGMTDRLIVLSRRFNDHEKKTTWKIIENQGLIPVTFLSHDVPVPYSSEGDRNDHNIAVYSL